MWSVSQQAFFFFIQEKVAYSVLGPATEPFMCLTDTREVGSSYVTILHIHNLIWFSILSHNSILIRLLFSSSTDGYAIFRLV